MALISFTKRNPNAAILIFFIVLFFVIPVTVSILVFNRVMHVGHPTSFSPSDSRVGFTEGPDSRGTINIVWACFSTIFTCVYVSLHLDVPLNEGERRGLRGKLWSWMLTIWQKARWIFINIVAPELVVFLAMSEFQSARNGRERMKKILGVSENDNEKKWTLTRAFHTVIEFSSARKWKDGVKNILNGKETIDDKQWTLAQAFFADMGGFKVRSAIPSQHSPPETTAAEASSTGSRQGGSENHEVDQAQGTKLETPLSSDVGVDTEAARMPISKAADDIVVRSGEDFYAWLESNPSTIEYIDFKQVGLHIEGLSKADSLLKTLTVLQASWLVVQTVVRATKNQSVSELEVTTCAYVVCTVITYICWWHKPYGAQEHILLHVPSSRGPTCTKPTPSNKSNDTIDRTDALIPIILSGFIGAIIGAIHCTLWNATFANSNGQLLWRICCITQIVSPLLMSVFFGLASASSEWYLELIIFSFLPCFIQFCARIVLFILIGYSFQSLPAGVYTNTDWTWSWFPHVN